MLAVLQANFGMIMAVLFALSEALALIPGVKSNSVFQLVFNALKAIVQPAPKE
jgi:hypothetical protein